MGSTRRTRSSMNRRAMQRLQLENDLRRAVESHGEQFEVHYQPKVSVSSAEVLGMEALLLNNAQPNLASPQGVGGGGDRLYRRHGVHRRHVPGGTLAAHGRRLAWAARLNGRQAWILSTSGSRWCIREGRFRMSTGTTDINLARVLNDGEQIFDVYKNGKIKRQKKDKSSNVAEPGRKVKTRLRACFGRARSHNIQLAVATCGIITARDTFFHSEGPAQAAVRDPQRVLIHLSLRCPMCQRFFKTMSGKAPPPEETG